MSLLVLPHAQTAQPQQGGAVNWASPLTCGLTALFTFDKLGAFENVRQELHATTFGTAPVRASIAQGRAALAGDGGLIAYGSPGRYMPTAAYTHLAWVRPTAFDAWAGVFVCSNAVGSDAVTGLQRNANVDGMYVFHSGSSLGGGSIAALTDGTPHVIALTCDGGANVDVYKDGASWFSGSVGAIPPSYTDGRIVFFGERSASNGSNSSGYYILHAVWARKLSAAEVRAVSANPWQLFAPAPRRLWVGAAAGGNVYNVSISEAGSASDSVSAQLAAVATLAESAAAADAVSSIATLPASVSESGSASDSISTGAQYSASVTESASAADVVSALASLGASIAEAGNATDAVSAVGVLVASLAETAAAGDGVSSTAVLLAALTEAGSATDSVSAGSGNIYPVSISESGSAADSIVAALVAVAQLAESGSAQDSVSAALQALGAIAENASATDQVSAAATLLAQLLETGNAQDVVYILQGIATSGQRGRVSGPARTTIYGPGRTSINP